MADRKRTDDDGAQASGAPERATRRRGAELVAAIHAAALAEAAEHGMGRLTMEGIARRAGTAKTSLYRRWSAVEDIVLEALHGIYPMEEVSPGADDLRGDLIAALRLMREGVMASVNGNVMMTILDEAHRSPELRKRLYVDVFDARGGRFTATVLRHYAARGRFDPALLTPVVLDLGEALMFKYAMDSLLYPDDDYIAAIVDQAIIPALGLTPAAVERWRNEDPPHPG